MIVGLQTLALVVQAHDIITRGNLRQLAYDLATPTQRKRSNTHCVLCGARLR